MKKAKRVHKSPTKTRGKKTRKFAYAAHDLPQTGYVRLPTVLLHIGIGKSSWWNGIQEGRFPKPLKLSPRVSVWRAEDIRKLISELGRQAA